MSEYTKKTVADLQEILKSRGLPATGKKADLIARLTTADKESESTTEPAQSADATETTVAQTETEAPPAAVSAAEANPAASEKDGNAQTGEAAADTPAAQQTAQPSYALNLAASNIDLELEKRKARAARFNTGVQANTEAEATETANSDGDAQKILERAQRFGTGQAAIGKLDEALSTEKHRGKKRGPAAEHSVTDDPGLKKNFGHKKGFGRRGRDNPSKPTGVQKPGANFTSDKDRQAAEARKKRFGGS